MVMDNFVFPTVFPPHAGAGVHTQQLRQAVEPDLTPNQRTAVMARIWREERNFWISVLTFLLWG